MEGSNIIYEHVSNIMLERFPELKSIYIENIDPEDETLQHIIIGTVFTPFLINNIEKNQDEGILMRCFGFIDEMAGSKDVLVQEIVAFSIIEVLGDEPNNIIKSKKYMGPKTLEILGEVNDFWRR